MSKELWINRPAAKASDIPWKPPVAPQNPVVKGSLLHYGAIAISNLGFVQSFLWGNAGFSSLRNKPELADSEPRYDPTVILSDGGSNRRDTKDFLASLLKEDLAAKDIGSDKFHLSILDYHKAYKSGRVTPTDVATALLPLIQRDVKNPSKHSVGFLQVREDLVLKAAEESTRRYKAGKPLSPIDGLPVAVKDEVDVKGYRKCYGSKLDFTRKDDATSFCVLKWQEAGAVLMGKTNMHELGCDTTNNNPNFGTPLNPNNEDYYCGGSSGGSAYTVAAGLMPLVEGNDGGGSVRIPANYTGLYGLKTSHGRVSKRPSLNLARSTGVCGPIAANMIDLEIGYRIMAQPDQHDPDSAMFKIPGPVSLHNDHKKILGIYKPWFDRADPIVKASCQKAIDYLTSTRNYTVVDITIPLIHEGQLAHAMTILSELCIGINPSDHHKLTAPNKVLLSVARKTTSIDLLQAQRLRELLMQHLSHLYQTHPGLIIVTPTTANAGWPIEKGDLAYGLTNGNQQIRNMEYAWLANFVGCPAISAPIAYTDPKQGEGKIPVGIMGMSEWCREDDVIAFGYDCERYVNEALEGGRVKPVNHTNVLDLAAKGK